MDLLGGQTGKMADLLLDEKSSFLSDLEFIGFLLEYNNGILLPKLF